MPDYEWTSKKCVPALASSRHLPLSPTSAYWMILYWFEVTTR
jgi:hypothetical protein